MRKKNNKDLPFYKRRKDFLKRIKSEVAIFSSSEVKVFTRDQHYSYKQNSDLFYLTGIEEENAILVLSGLGTGARSILFLEEEDFVKAKWGSSPLGLKKAKRKYKVDEIRNYNDFSKDLAEILKYSQVLHYALSTHSKIDQIIIDAIKTSYGPSIIKPCMLHDSRLLTAIMRIKKEKEEISHIKHACEISSKSVYRICKNIKSFKSEKHAAKSLEAEFMAQGAGGISFNTIIASGKNATVLHHEPSYQPLWKNDLVLIDSGASYKSYCSDMTRTIPVSGKFNKYQAELYDIVYKAYLKAKDKAVVGSTLSDVHKVAVNTLCKGLIEIGLLKGSLSSVIKKATYKKFYMHNTSHWVGLDVHDIAPITYDAELLHPHKRPLESRNIITIEPGLYIDPKDKSIPSNYRGIGIRLEDTILITKTENKTLTDYMPMCREEVERMMANA